MVDEPAQDLVEIEFAADVLGHAPECLEAVQLLAALVEQSRSLHQARQLTRGHAQQLEVMRGEARRAFGHGEQRSPGTAVAFDRDGKLGAPAGHDRRRPHDPGQRIGPDPDAFAQREADDAVRRRQV